MVRVFVAAQGTSGGTVISFDRIEAVNQLRADLVYETVKNYTVDYDKTWIYVRDPYIQHEHMHSNMSC